MDKKNIINDEMLDKVNGGALFYSKEIEGADHDFPWEIIDENGDVRGRFAESEFDLAAAAARKAGYGDDIIGWKEVMRRRNNRK